MIIGNKVSRRLTWKMRAALVLFALVVAPLSLLAQSDGDVESVATQKKKAISGERDRPSAGGVSGHALDEETTPVIVRHRGQLESLEEGTIVQLEMKARSPARLECDSPELGKLIYSFRILGEGFELRVSIGKEAATRLDRLGFDNRLVCQALHGRTIRATGRLSKNPVFVVKESEKTISRYNYTVKIVDIEDFMFLPQGSGQKLPRPFPRQTPLPDNGREQER